MRLKEIIPVILCLIAFSSYSQEKKYALSGPVDIKETGWNKVLCMKNGNTMLFHMEINKLILIKIFDSMHVEIGSVKYSGELLNINALQDVIFKGLFEIKGEAILFIEQEHMIKRKLIRLRFSGINGKLMEEKIAGEWENKFKPTKFYVIKNISEDNYAILFSTDVIQFKQSNVFLRYYNSAHDPIRDVPIEMNRKAYDIINVIGAESQPKGICITFLFSSLITNGTYKATGGMYGTSVDIYNSYLAIYYVPKDSATAITKVADLLTEMLPYFTNYTYNPFAKTLNILLTSYKEVVIRNGIDWCPGSVINHVLFKLDEDFSDIKINFIKNNLANEYYWKYDSSRYFNGLPLKTFTNENGLSTVIMESYDRYLKIESRIRNNFNSYLGNIGITQFDDDGNEIWGAVLPNSQYFMSYKKYYNPKELAKRWQEQAIFNDLPEQVYDRQFVSANTYYKDKNFYVICNNVDRNIASNMGRPADTVFNFNMTNICCYKINRKKEITKKYLFGEPEPNEFISSFIEGADFDEQRSAYTALVRYKKGDDISLRMAWCRLD